MKKIGMNRGLATATAMALVIGVAVWFVLGGSEKTAVDDPLKVNKGALSKYESTLTYRMVRFDVENGIADIQAANKARVNIGAYFQWVDEQCLQYQQVRDFLLCANQVVGEHFDYEVSEDVSNSYARQRSDCDLNAFLIVDVARMHGFDPYMMYSPGHAFITWTGRDGEVYYLETTKNDNRGKLADINDAFYVRSLDGTYYTRYGADAVLSIYKALVYRLSANKAYIVGLYNALPGNSLVADSYYEYLMIHNRIGPDEIADIIERLKTDPTSETLSLILASWYVEQGDTGRALSALGALPPRFCTSDCIWLGIEAWSDYLGYHEQGTRVSDFYGKYLKDLAIFSNYEKAQDFLKSVGLIIAAIFCVLLWFFGRRRGKCVYLILSGSKVRRKR